MIYSKRSHQILQLDVRVVYSSAAYRPGHLLLHGPGTHNSLRVRIMQGNVDSSAAESNPAGYALAAQLVGDRGCRGFPPVGS